MFQRVLLSVFVGLAVLACKGENAAVQAEDQRPPTEGISGGRETERETLVVVDSLSVGSIRDEVVVPAKVESRVTVAVFPKLSNLPVTEVFVEKGQSVRQGDPLMSLFDVELRLTEQGAAAALEEAEQQLQQQLVAVDEEEARVRRAQRTVDKTAADLERLQGLIEEGIVNQQEVDDARLAADQARDDLELARLTQRRTAVSLELARIGKRKAEVEHARAQSDLSHALVRAPIDGVVALRDVDIGELSSMSAAAFSIVDTSQPVLELRVPQDSLSRLAAGQPVEVRALTQVDGRYQGTVRTVNPVLDMTTGTVHVTVDLTPAPGLVPGLFCEAHIVTGSRDDALLVDKRAVLYDDDQPYVFVVDDALGSVSKVAFAHGASTPTSIEILGALGDADALSADSNVVLVGQESLKDGARVRVREDPVEG